MKRLNCLKSCILSTVIFLVVVCMIFGALGALIGWHSYRVNQVALASDPHTVTFDGEERSYRIHVPDNLPADAPVPLVFVIHGGGGTAEGMERVANGRFNELADQDGFIVVYPQGIDKQWSDGRSDDFRPESHQQGVDDVGYFEFLIDEVSNQYNIDSQRIYATGISNGGFMSMRLACEASDKFAAVGIVTATLSDDLAKICNPDDSIGIIMLNGTDDPLVPYEGGYVEVLWRKRGAIQSTDETIDFWVEHNHCQATPQTEKLPDNDPDDQTRVTRSTYGDCDDGVTVVLDKIEGGGHTWPDGIPYLPEFMVGRVSRDINGADEIWTFFQTQTLAELTE